MGGEKYLAYPQSKVSKKRSHKIYPPEALCQPGPYSRFQLGGLGVRIQTVDNWGGCSKLWADNSTYITIIRNPLLFGPCTRGRTWPPSDSGPPAKEQNSPKLVRTPSNTALCQLSAGNITPPSEICHFFGATISRYRTSNNNSRNRISYQPRIIWVHR